MTLHRITKISRDDFPNTFWRKLSSEALAIKELKVDEGFKTKCRWKHYALYPEIPTISFCGGRNLVYKAAKRYGVKVKASCQEGILYVLRVA